MVLYCQRALLCPPLGNRLTVGQRPLKPLIGVRVPVPQLSQNQVSLRDLCPTAVGSRAQEWPKIRYFDELLTNQVLITFWSLDAPESVIFAQGATIYMFVEWGGSSSCNQQMGGAGLYHNDLLNDHVPGTDTLD